MTREQENKFVCGVLELMKSPNDWSIYVDRDGDPFITRDSKANDWYTTIWPGFFFAKMTSPVPHTFSFRNSRRLRRRINEIRNIKNEHRDSAALTALDAALSK